MMRFWSIAVLCFLDLFRQTACKEVPIKNATFSNFWFEQPFLLDGAGEQWKLVEGEDGAETCSNGKDAEIWLLTKTVPESFNQTLQEVQLHIEIEAQFKKCEGKECFKDGFELYRYIGDGEPRVPFNPKDPTLVEKERQKARQYFQSNFTYLGNITGNSTTKERVNTTITLSLKEFRQITFGIKSRGACGEVTRMKVYYYACEERFIKNVMFKETMAPPNGTKTVFGKCSPNSLPAMTNMRDNFTAYCHSNGTWSTNGTIAEWCRCDEGYYESTDHGCLTVLIPTTQTFNRTQDVTRRTFTTAGFSTTPQSEIEVVNTKTSDIPYLTILVGVGVFLVIVLNVLFGILIYKRRHGAPRLATSVSIPVDAIEIQNDFVEEPAKNNDQESDPTAPYEEVHIYDELNFDIHRQEERKTNGQISEADGEIAPHEDTQMPAPSACYTEPNIHRKDEREKNYQPLLKRDSDYLIPADSEIAPYEKAQISAQPGRQDERETNYQPLLKRDSDYGIPADVETATHKEPQMSIPGRHNEETNYDVGQQLLKRDFIIPADGEIAPYEEAQMSPPALDYTELGKNRTDESETKYAYQPLLRNDSDYVIPADGEMTQYEETQMSTPPDYTELDKNRPDEKETKYAYHPLLKRDSDYIVPADDDSESHEDVQKVKDTPGYKELHNTKREQDDIY